MLSAEKDTNRIQNLKSSLQWAFTAGWFDILLISNIKILFSESKPLVEIYNPIKPQACLVLTSGPQSACRVFLRHTALNCRKSLLIETCLYEPPANPRSSSDSQILNSSPASWPIQTHIGKYSVVFQEIQHSPHLSFQYSLHKINKYFLQRSS
jgi:hypothetical protein